MSFAESGYYTTASSLFRDVVTYDQKVKNKTPYIVIAILFDLIAVAARPLKRSGVDALYRSFISAEGAISIARCNEILIAHNYPALNEGMNTEGISINSA